jgi:ribosomal protein S18 acetylase RimI-like enzyme
LKSHHDLVLQFRIDSFVCSFGTPDKFWEENGPKGELYLARLREKLADDPSSVVHAWLQNTIVGQVELGTFKLDPSIGYVNLYYLIPEMRGKGLSDQLDAYAIGYLRGKGYKRARLSVAPSNSRAVRYYQKMGWHDIGARRDVLELNLMEKEIQ